RRAHPEDAQPVDAAGERPAHRLRAADAHDELVAAARAVLEVGDGVAGGAGNRVPDRLGGATAVPGQGIRGKRILLRERGAGEDREGGEHREQDARKRRHHGRVEATGVPGYWGWKRSRNSESRSAAVSSKEPVAAAKVTARACEPA